MYRCCNFRRFLKLLCIDAFVFVSLYLVAGTSGCMKNDADAGNAAAVRMPIIMYHSITEHPSERYIVSPQELENDLSWLARNGYRSVLAEELADYVSGNAELPEKPVMITFDDGFYNNLYYALPLLEKYDMSAVISVVGSYTAGVAPQDVHNPSYAYLIWEDIKKLLDTGRIEIGNHTYNMHTNAVRKGCMRKSGESEEQYASALTGDVGLLQSLLYEKTGRCPVTFAYPFGYISKESVPVLRELGFAVTLSCYEGINVITDDPECLYGLKRFNREGTVSTEEFMRKLG